MPELFFKHYVKNKKPEYIPIQINFYDFLINFDNKVLIDPYVNLNMFLYRKKFLIGNFNLSSHDQIYLRYPNSKQHSF